MISFPVIMLFDVLAFIRIQVSSGYDIPCTCFIRIQFCSGYAIPCICFSMYLLY